MKTLIVYSNDGTIVFSQPAYYKAYGLSYIEIPECKEIIGYDLENKKVITVDENSSQTRKDNIREELMKKNKMYNTKKENEELKKANDELNGELKNNLDKLNTKVNVVQVALMELNDEDEENA